MKVSTSQKPLFPLAVVGHCSGSISKEPGTSNRSLFLSSKPALLDQVSHLHSFQIMDVLLLLHALYADWGSKLPLIFLTSGASLV